MRSRAASGPQQEGRGRVEQAANAFAVDQGLGMHLVFDIHGRAGADGKAAIGLRISTFVKDRRARPCRRNCTRRPSFRLRFWLIVGCHAWVIDVTFDPPFDRLGNNHFRLSIFDLLLEIRGAAVARLLFFELR